MTIIQTDLEALRTCEADPNTYLAIIFPVVHDRLSEIEAIFARHTRLLHRTSLALTRNGLRNLTVQIYKHEHWLGPASRNHPGASAHVASRFSGGRPVTVYLLAAGDLQDVKEAKQEARELLRLDNVPLHTADTREETVRIAQQVFGPNALPFLNDAYPRSHRRFRELFATYHGWVASTGLPAGDFCVVGSAVLAAWGLRPCVDWDFIARHDIEPPGPDLSLSTRDFEAGGLAVETALSDPDWHFYYDGYKFLSLAALRRAKAARGLAKDRGDVALIDSVGRPAGVGRSLARIREAARTWPSLGFRLLVGRVPTRARSPLKAAYRRLGALAFGARVALDRIGPAEKATTYRGFRVFYRRGSPAVVAVKRGGIAAPLLLRQLVPLMAQHGWDDLVLVGPAEGLVALHVAATRPSVLVTCLESRPRYATNLARTIAANELGGRIRLVTDRGLEPDGWWAAAGMPPVSAIHWNRRASDFRLASARGLIETCRPHLFVTGPPGGGTDEPGRIYDLFDANGYDLFTLNLIRVDRGSFVETFREGFYAAPRPGETPGATGRRRRRSRSPGSASSAKNGPGSSE